MTDDGQELFPIPLSPPSLPSWSQSSPEEDSSWIISIHKEMDEAREYEASSNWKTQTIYRVPKIIRELDETAYTPRIVSIGPYHRELSSLQGMNIHKLRALCHVLNRTGHDVLRYFDAVHNLEDRARRCYEASLDISSKDFVKTLVLDSIFLLEIFRGVALNKFPADYDLHDPVFSIHSNMHSLQSDMILLENQLPLFVLDRISALQFPGDPPDIVARLAFHFFHPLETFASSFSYRITLTNDERLMFYDLILGMDTGSSSNENASSSKALHCLDLFRRNLHFRNQKQPSQPDARPYSRLVALRKEAFTRSFLPNKKSSYQLPLISCVDELRNAGIKFRCRRTNKFWDIKFKNGVLKIPRICIERNTKSLFLNLMAFETCHLEHNNEIIAYVIFMDCLINSEVDVKYLREKGIIKHWLGNDEEVAHMFNRLTSKVTFDINSCYLSELHRQVYIYYKQSWNTWRANLIHKYFSNPWTIISLVAATVLLLLTFAQTFYSIYGYYKPK